MKKIFAIVLAGIMMLSLAACGGTGSSTPAAASSEPAGASGTPASGEPAASTLSGKRNLLLNIPLGSSVIPAISNVFSTVP